MAGWPGSRTHRIGWFAYCTDGDAVPESRHPFRRQEACDDSDNGWTLPVLSQSGYLSLTLLYLGLGVLFSSAWVCVLVVPTLLIINIAVVRKEEQHLESQFGEEYLRYKTAVRRWL